MPLRFDSDAAYDRWVAERERVEMGSPIGRPAAPGRKLRRQLGKGRALRHLTRPGHRRRAGASLRTLLGPLL